MNSIYTFALLAMGVGVLAWFRCRMLQTLAAKADRQIKTLIEHMSDGVLIIDSMGQLTDANASACAVTGFDRSELLKKNIDLLLLPDRSSSQSLAFETRFTPNARTLGRMRRKDGTEFPYESQNSYIERGRYRRLLIRFRDLTDRLRMASENAGIDQHLAHTARLVALGTMTAAVAHELSNPLFAIKGTAHLIITDPNCPPGIKGFAERIDRNCDRMDVIVAKMKALARSTTDTDWADVSLNEAVTEALLLLDQRIKRMNVAVELKLSDQIPKVRADVHEMESVIHNLLTNSLDAFDEDPPLRDRRIVISTFETADHWAGIQFCDNGRGMTEEVRRQAFDPYFNTKEIGKGTGLGLSIVHGIVHKFQGRISIESATAGGVCFLLTFPPASGGTAPDPAAAD